MRFGPVASGGVAVCFKPKSPAIRWDGYRRTTRRTRFVASGRRSGVL